MAIYPSTTVELVPDAATAQRLIQELERAGIPETSISTLETSTGGSVGATRPSTGGTGTEAPMAEHSAGMPVGRLPGAEADRTFGTGDSELAPATGPDSGLIDDFVRLGLSEGDARHHAAAVERGATALVIRLIDEDQGNKAREVLTRHSTGS
jgi:hypothetical protein